ncbi:MAG: XRE family transcriptional regulator [Clostridia bacterium]|nr:XRE family transcriptional regulator [Clostridia bacterium]
MKANLKAEMARAGVRNKDIQKVLGCSPKSVRNKICGVSEFSVAEALAIHKAFFSPLSIEYLFDEAADGRGVKTNETDTGRKSSCT